jgi:hypothetical protein
MQMYSKALIVLSTLALCSGSAVLVFTATVTRFATKDDVRILTTRYNPNGDATYQGLRTYENLYAWTEHIMHHRNHLAMRSHCTLGATLVIVGMLLIAWAVDRERLHRRLRSSEDHAARCAVPGAGS